MNNDNPVFPHSSICCHGNGACGDWRALFIVHNLGSCRGISTGRNAEMEENKGAWRLALLFRPQSQIRRIYAKTVEQICLLPDHCAHEQPVNYNNRKHFCVLVNNSVHKHKKMMQSNFMTKWRVRMMFLISLFALYEHEWPHNLTTC